ncbi:alpha/beta hydrolase [Brevibacillus sp. SYP-B805]|uniref:alpha/beta hydrolase n=1 Tax=Brevibacillus sp. SYP-B805 TaxID=1578199 RepID=UPI0013EBD655|nr:alpha/beta fold hydrolase [Brevibacillus sp. SYP-B805]NGQ93632.1 alpha/beta hydrolase [Brevibacillus sp. SYP-B805]
MKDHVWVNSRGKRLSAMVHHPDNSPQPDVVIFCHGFTGEKVGGSQLNLRLAQAIEAAGFAVIRFEYAGSGESEGNFASDTTISGWKADLQQVVAWVKKQPHFQDSRLYLLGQSLGGCIVFLHEDPDRLIAGRIGISPVIRPLEDFRERILGPALWAASEAGKTISDFFGKNYSLEPSFVRDILEHKHNPLAACQSYDSPVLLIHGTADVPVPAEGSCLFYETYAGPKELLLLEGGDHSLAQHFEKVKEKVVEWLIIQNQRRMG